MQGPYEEGRPAGAALLFRPRRLRLIFTRRVTGLLPIYVVILLLGAVGVIELYVAFVR